MQSKQPILIFPYHKHRVFLDLDNTTNYSPTETISMLVVRQKLRPEELYSFP